METVKEDGVKYLVVRKSATEADVSKYVRKDGELVMESKHHVINGSCDCKGFEFRKNCTHLDQMAEPVAGRAVELAEARMVMRDMLREFGNDARMPDEPYEKDGDGHVVCVNVDVVGDKKIVYEGCYSGVKVRLRMTARGGVR